LLYSEQLISFNGLKIFTISHKSTRTTLYKALKGCWHHL